MRSFSDFSSYGGYRPPDNRPDYFNSNRPAYSSFSDGRRPGDRPELSLFGYNRPGYLTGGNSRSRGFSQGGANTGFNTGPQQPYEPRIPSLADFSKQTGLDLNQAFEAPDIDIGSGQFGRPGGFGELAQRLLEAKYGNANQDRIADVYRNALGFAGDQYRTDAGMLGTRLGALSDLFGR